MKRILIVSVLALAVVYVVLVFFLGSVVKAGVNGFGPKLTQTKVELDAASISPLTGSGTLSHLVVGNPKGWSSQDAFTLGQVSVKVEPFSILGDHVVVDEILIDGPEFNYETKLLSSNIKDLLKSIESFSGGSGSGKTPATESGKPIKFVVKKFRLTHGTARLGVGAAGLPVPLPAISIDDLGVKEGGITPDQLAGALMKNVLGSIVSGTADAMGKLGSTAGATAVEKTKEAASKASDTVKKLFGGNDKP